MIPTPAQWMDVRCRLVTPVVVVLAPTVKVDLKPVSLLVDDGRHAGQARVLPVPSFQLHPDLKGPAPLSGETQLRLKDSARMQKNSQQIL